MSVPISRAYIREKWSHAGFQRYFQNMGWIFFARVGNLIISFAATAYLARQLGPTNYGELSYAISFVALFSFIAALGIEQVLYRDLVKYPEQKDIYMGSAMALRLGASVIAVMICVGSALWLSPKDVSFYLIFLLSLGFIFNSFQMINCEFQATVQSKYPSLLSLGITFTLNILKILVIVFGGGIIYLALVLLLESIFYGLGFVYFRTKIFGSITQWKARKDVMIRILRDSWPLIFSSAFALIYARIDQIMIKNMIDAGSVGVYDAAVRLSEVWYFIPSIIATSLFPAIINSRNISPEVYRSRIRRLMILLAALSLAIAIPATLLSDWIVHIIFGPAFLGAAAILQVYIWSNIFTSLNTVSNLYMVAENFKKSLFFSTFAGMAANVVLNAYLIPIFGTLGAAYATLISYAIPCTYALVLLKVKKVEPGTVSGISRI